jgi:hypothetical protein
LGTGGATHPSTWLCPNLMRLDTLA